MLDEAQRFDDGYDGSGKDSVDVLSSCCQGSSYENCNSTTYNSLTN